MKRILAFILVIAMLLSLCACGGRISDTDRTEEDAETEETTPTEPQPEQAETEENTDSGEAQRNVVAEPEDGDSEVEVTEEEVPDFNSLGDPKLLQYMQDSLYADITDDFQSEDYIIENITAIYYSKEYLEEVSYNSQANIFFGYTLAELDEQFQGERYVFTLGEDNQTDVQLFENYDDTYDRVIRNVAIGTGVILICVTVSVVTGGLGAAPVSMIFAASAKTATSMALSSGAISGLIAGAIKGFQTGNVEEAVKAAALAGSESFMWGAIFGAISGGVSEACALRDASTASETAENAAKVDKAIPTPQQSEITVSELYGGRTQVTYLGGEEVPYGTPGGTRPDIVRIINDHLEAIEVKNYDLSKSANRSELYSELVREIADRVENLPSGSTQRIVLDVTGRNFPQGLIDQVVETITTKLADIYMNIPIDIIGV